MCWRWVLPSGRPAGSLAPVTAPLWTSGRSRPGFGPLKRCCGAKRTFELHWWRCRSGRSESGDEGRTSMATDTEGAVEAKPAQIPFDPFELEDVVSGNIRDPYPRFAELRRQAPVHAGPIDLGEEVPEPEPDTGKPPAITVFGFDEAVEVLRDNETYSSTIYAGVMGEVMGRTILQMDEPEHRIQRALVSPSLRSKVLERWEGDLVQQVVNELDRLVRRRRACRSGAGSSPSISRAGDRAHPWPSPVGLPHVPTVGDRDHQRDGQLGAGDGRVGRIPRLLRGDLDRAAASSGRGPDQRAGTGGGRRPQARRRGDLLLPPTPVARPASRRPIGRRGACSTGS